MSIEALLAILTTAAIIGLVFGVDRALRRDRTALDKRLRRYGGHAYQLSDDEQKQAASAQVTQMLAKRVEASISGRTFAAPQVTEPFPVDHRSLCDFRAVCAARWEAE